MATAAGRGPELHDHRRAARAARAGARLRGEGDPAAGGRVRRAHDPSRRRDREGARGRADEPARPGRVRRARALPARGLPRRRGAELGLLGHRHLARLQRPRRRAGDRRRHRRAEARRGSRRSSRSRSSAPSASPSPTPARTSRGSRRTPSARATSTSSTARRRSSRTRATRPGRSSSRRPTRPPATRDVGLHRPDGHAGRDDRDSTSTRWASARPTPPRSRCPTSSSRRRTGSARRATASRSR